MAANDAPVISEPLRLALRIFHIGVLLLAIPHQAVAQERPRPAIEFAAGWVGFADDGIVSEGLVGGSARLFLLPRVSIGPEVLFIQGDGHSHLIATGNVTWDVFAASGDPRVVAPFLVVGGGLFQTRESFPIGTFTSREGAFTGGGGVRTRASRRVTVGIDARIGWELHVRVNGLVGIQLGR